RLALEEKQKAEEEAKAEAERIKAEKEEAERLALEEKQKAEEEAKAEAERIKAEKEEAARIAKEEKLRLEEEAKAEKERIKAEKEEAARLAKEEKIRAAEEAKIKKVEKEEISKDIKKETFYIEGRVLKSKFGVKGVQVRLLLASEEKIYLTDKNGYYKIAGLEKGGNYLITVLSGKEILNISPKSRTYKNLSGNMKNQNFYVVEKIVIDRNKKSVKKPKSSDQEQDWNTRYGLENSNGIIKKDIEW
ncbi:carboxypeptidase-like regulatory domain-containing protein, partial [Candidatus Ruminimicrobiellum ovillum]|uniref:carboxypeptidase-like regulatory domain-containing protein n=2 Tax=Candidatus Ruminimicrobiellum ovillum TaxID=1947927 RepID=UPI00355A6EF1